MQNGAEHRRIHGIQHRRSHGIQHRRSHGIQHRRSHGIQHRRRARAETVDGTKLKEVNDFKYLGSWVDSTEEDIRIRKGLAWAAANKMKKIWKSNISRNLKERFFMATVESVLLLLSCMDRKSGH